MNNKMQLTKRRVHSSKQHSFSSSNYSKNYQRNGKSTQVCAAAALFLVVLCTWHVVLPSYSSSYKEQDQNSILRQHGSSSFEAATVATTTMTHNNDASGTTTAATTTGDVDITTTSNLAYRHSYGLFHDVSDKDWELLRTKTKSSSWYANPLNPLENIDNAKRWRDDNMKPTFDCPRLEGVGVGGQRTKLVCNPKRLVKDDTEECLIYSIGSAGDYHFEDNIVKMHNKKCEIHVFDPADWSRRGDPSKKNIHYHAWGIGSTYDTTSKSVVWPKGRKGGFKTFPETLRLLGHENRTIDLFKMDCEGCEWSSIKDWIHLEPRQILIEIHGVPSPKGTPKARWYQKPMDIVRDYYDTFQNHGYALYSKDSVGDLAVELSFIKLHDDFWK